MTIQTTAKGLLLAAALLSAAACSGRKELTLEETEALPEDVRIIGKEDPADAFEQGEVTLKLSEELAAQLEAATDEEGNVDVGSVIPMTRAVGSLDVKSARRLFPYAGKFEPRTRKEGLHLWYIVRFDESRSLTRAAGEFGGIEGVEIIEYNPKIKLIGDPVVTGYVVPSEVASPTAALPFDDPMLKDQWHYFNDGSIRGSQSGCDINVVPVWRSYTTGKKDVIVSVVDGGIDFNHEDLADNMWHNPQKSGDARYGYNFTDNTFKITPHDHGTHVAGTIAAVNNNGKGVSGIAGGDKKRGVEGVKLMSCQIFSKAGSGGSGSTAIKWGADHGAVISQNSWGYPDLKETPTSLRVAVDYFTQYAGLDENGKQVGPMAGGLVIFAAGNEDVATSSSDYDKILAVTSVGSDYKKAYYSCYGPWADVAAPGGDAKKGSQVISTLPGNAYGRMQGTSMACPHVSGVAALIVSQFGGQGFTSSALRKRIESSVTDISAYNRNFYLGKGLVNTYKAIAGSGGKAPDAVTGLKAGIQSNNVHFSLTVPRDSDDGKPNTIIVYFDTNEITDVGKATFSSFYVGDLEPGETLTGTVTGLQFNTVYYLTALACDLAGNKSKPCAGIEVTTGGNNAPVFTVKGGSEFKLKPHETALLDFTYDDPDGHYTTISLENSSPAETLDTLDKSKPKVRIVAVDADAGDYESKIVVTDVYGLSSTLPFKYTVLENHEPEVVKEIPDLVFGERTKTLQFKEVEHFLDEDGEQLAYTIVNSNETVANVNYNKGEFFVTSLNFGYCDVTVTATDIRKATAVVNFRIMVRDSNEPVDVYPNPVRDILYVRTSEECQANVRMVSSIGAVVFEDDLKVSVFDPAKIDVSKFSAGVYTVVVKTGETEVRKTVVKL